MLILGVHSIAVVWRYGSRCRKNVCRYLQCVSVPDPTVALAFDEIGRNLTNTNERWLLPMSNESAGYSIAIHTGIFLCLWTQCEASWNYGMSPCLQWANPVIQNLSLHIPAGKTIAIVGSTGSGKSTLVKLLLRLYEVQQNHHLDALRELKLKDLRSCIGLVSQDVFFISWHCGGEYCLRGFQLLHLR